MTDLTLYATISMCLICGLLVAMIALALLDRRDSSPEDSLMHQMLLEQRSRQPRTWPTHPDARGEGILVDTQQPGRHRRLDAAMSMLADRRPSLATATLDQALAWLAVDRVKREAERVAFRQMQMTTRRFATARPLLSGHR